jgi:hypothetical protein
VTFQKNWQRDINTAKPYKVTKEDMQIIKAELSALFGEIFRSELKSAGYVLTDEQAGDVLLVRPAILDLNVNSPDVGANRTRSLNESAGDMTLYLELRDSITGDILVKALDFQFDRSKVTPYMQDKSRNEKAARRILSNWAETLVNGLHQARERAQSSCYPPAWCCRYLWLRCRRHRPMSRNGLPTTAN